MSRMGKRDGRRTPASSLAGIRSRSASSLDRVRPSAGTGSTVEVGILERTDPDTVGSAPTDKLLRRFR